MLFSQVVACHVIGSPGVVERLFMLASLVELEDVLVQVSYLYALASAYEFFPHASHQSFGTSISRWK